MDTLAIDRPMPIEERVGITRITRQSDDSAVDYKSNHTSDGTPMTVVSEKAASVSWADVVKGVAHRDQTKCVASKNKRMNNVFRKIILSKQSSE